MLNKGRILWCIQASILVLLSLMSSTDLIIKEKRIEVYPISVVIEGDNNNYYVNFRKDMDQVAVESHGNASFVTLYADHDQAQRMELVKRETRDGTRAVILAPAKPEEAVGKLEDMNPGCPVILLGQSPDEGTALDTIGVDGREIGGLLGEAAAPQASRDVPVYLSYGGLDYGDGAWVCEGVRTVLDEQGYHYRLTKRRNQDIYRQAIQETGTPGGDRITVIALDVQSPDQATRILEEDTICQGRVAGFYDVGSTTLLLRALGRGIVTGLTAYNQSDKGYSSVEQTVGTIQSTRQKQNTVLEAIYVDKDKLRGKTYEKMLYPIK